MSINRGMDKEDMIHVCSGILLSSKKNEIVPFAATWMDLESVILSTSDRERQILYHLYVESRKMIQMNIFASRNRDRDNKYVDTKGEMGGMN